MPSNYSLLIMYVRFGLAFVIWAVAFSIIALAVKLLIPKNHPSGIYLRSRISIAGQRTATALSPRAAAAEKLPRK